MKKLLLKWFPNYFKNVVEFDSIELINHPLKLVVVEPGTTKTFDSLGVTHERGQLLYKETKKAMLDHQDRIKAMIELETNGTIKHINEFYLCVLIMENELERMSGPAGLIKLLMGGGPQE